MSVPRSVSRTRKEAATRLSTSVYEAIKDDILRGVYKPGEALTEKDFAKRYKSSWTDVRRVSWIPLEVERRSSGPVC